MSDTPVTPAPSQSDCADDALWSIHPASSYAQLWTRREANAVHLERTGRADPWPSLEDYAEAHRRVSAATSGS